MKDYTIFIYQGRYKYGHNSGTDYIIKTPLKSVLENLSFCFRSAKSFFEDSDMVFDSKTVTLSEVRKMVEAGTVIIPISSGIDRDEILNYMEIGLTPVFMKVKAYNQFKKDYTLEA